jgi:hypothetical protein
MKTIENLNVLIENFAEEKRKFKQTAQNSLKNVFKEFFEETPEIKVIKWTQCTPYFNDGDACVFGVHEPTFSNCDDPSLVSDYGELDMGEEEATENGYFAFEGSWSRPDDLPDHVVKNTNMISELICSSEMEEVLLAAFDDHVVVTVTRDGIDVDEYSHD